MLDVKSQDISIPDTVVVLCTASMKQQPVIWLQKYWQKNWPPA